MELYSGIRHAYRDFAEYARGESDTLTAWALQLAEDPELLAWVESLPAIKQQPNLVFAAARWHGVAAPGPYMGLRRALLNDDGTIRNTILERATQTNEVGRLATLAPAFAQFEGPLALIEVGASAGLNLYPDRWGYSWHTSAGTHRLGHEPRLECVVSGNAPLPKTVLEVAFRAGIDLNPLDVQDEVAMRWLETLVWPEQHERRTALRTAIDIARADPPRLLAGDLLNALPDLVTEANRFGTVVVFHSAVIAYLTPADRSSFDTMMRDLVDAGACHWVSNEGPGVLPSITGERPTAPARFVLGIDGTRVAQTHGHGRALLWE